MQGGLCHLIPNSMPCAVNLGSPRGRVDVTCLVICDAFVDVTHRSLRRVRIYSPSLSIMHNPSAERHSPTGVIWHNTWVPSMPTQLKVECGKTLLKRRVRYLSPLRPKKAYMLFLKKTSTTHSDIIIEICLPRQLLREEVIHAGSSDQLRQSSRQPKGIG